jgi:catechol 2,3-dioxygenase-like lactoylglutathione lyase family enzyme
MQFASGLWELRRSQSHGETETGATLGRVINGAHLLLYSKDPEADRAFFQDVLGFRSVDAGHGWIIFQLPAAEMGVHSGTGEFVQMHAEHPLLGAVLYLMCDDLRSTMQSLQNNKVACTEALEAEWGITTTVKLPSGGSIGLYQPKHPTAIDLSH